MAAIDPLEVPPFQLQSLLNDINPHVGDLLDLENTRDPPTPTVSSPLDLFARVSSSAIGKTPSRAPPIQVQTANTLHFYTLPGLDPIPQALIQSMTRVLAFAVDEQVMRFPLPDPRAPSGADPVGLCTFMRNQIRLFTLRERLLHVRDIPIPSILSIPRWWGSAICCADAENYNILGLDQLSFLPVMPLPGMTSPGVPPRIITSGDGGFVVLQASGEGSIAVFLTANGDPGGALIEMPRFPLDIAIDPPHFIALLPNNTIEIHNYIQQPPQIVQVIPRPEDFAPHAITMSGSTGYLVSAGERDSKLSIVRVPLSFHTPDDKQQTVEENILDVQSGSGLTPPATPALPPKDRAPASYARSRILLTSTDAVQSLVPTTLLSQAESLLGAGRENDVIRLLDIVRKKAGDEDQDIQVRYVYTELAYAKLRETNFEEAGHYFFRAETDARALIRLFPDLCEGLPEYDSQVTMSIFKGLEGTVRSVGNIDKIVRSNLVRNYSPHLGETEEPLPILRDKLRESARDMLRAFLHKTRNRRRYGGLQTRRSNEDGMWKAVDIVLARLFAEAGETSELLDLIKDSTLLTIRAVESALIEHRQFQGLITLCTKLGDESYLVNVLARQVEALATTEYIKDPFKHVVKILNETQDHVLVKQYGIWVLKHDPSVGLKIFTSRTIPKLDDAATLADMQRVDIEAAGRFLEHIVLNKRSTDANLHNQLVLRYVDEAIITLSEPGVRDTFSQLARDYVMSPPCPFLLWIASKDVIPEAMNIRVRLALFLQGSSLYNPRVLGHHRKALTTLVHEVHDSVSAEAYCALGGVVVPPKVAAPVGDRRGMQSQAWLINMGGRHGPPVTEEKRRELLKILMEVYTLGGESTSTQTAQLLNSQARNFDAIQVLETIPDSWSLRVISSFLERSLRRTTHESREGMILKQISAGQNLAIVDNAMQVVKDEGYVIEEADDEDEDGGSDRVLQQDPLDLDGPSSLVSEGLKHKEGWADDNIPIS
ncbi:hypothetical protein CTheo_6584 [Ceratobasidium theobromae]|uniref:CNH domain-containing protein n=1 Tax=Ceratobasidium theobromae TaxID=1582974 RepID=A0A5N5QET6_9AGAM|nr:hypothetical protein CTheo_6584 [Ceratobasidium theobromae]